MDAKTFYEQLAPELDPGGFKLYFTAQRLTGFELYKQFPYDIICGTFFVAGLGQQDFVSLTDEQIQRYKSLYDNMQILPVRTAAGEQGRIVGDQHIKKKGKIDHER